MNRTGDEGKVGYKLIISDIDLTTKNITETDFKEFSEKFPHIAEILLNPKRLTKDLELMEKMQIESWQTTAVHILNRLWKFKGSNVFQTPVNPEKLGKTYKHYC